MVRRFIGLTDAGLIRPYNQDAYYIDSEGRFFIVADGMGGHAGGQEASRIATETIQTYLDKNWDSDEDSAKILYEAVSAANRAIIEDQDRHPERGDMGTTAVVVIFRQDTTWCGHVGDSRMYRLRGSDLARITEDHTWVSKAVQAGDITQEQARSHPWRHVLSQCLGRRDLQEIDVQPLDVESGDRLLLCSDGLTEELSDTLIASYLESDSALDAVATTLVNAAKDKGGRDNITVLIVAIE